MHSTSATARAAKQHENVHHARMLDLPYNDMVHVVVRNLQHVSSVKATCQALRCIRDGGLSVRYHSFRQKGSEFPFVLHFVPIPKGIRQVVRSEAGQAKEAIAAHFLEGKGA